jgi:pimeloyl-ACP methyl ester carboxylesterase
MTAADELTREAANRKVTVGGIEINYYEAGSGPVLLCTHGGGPGANAWDNTKYSLAALARDFRVIYMIPVAGVLDGLSLIPDVRAHVWGGTGHFVVYEHPAEFARLVADFLRS